MVNNYVLQHCSPHYKQIIDEGYIKSGKKANKTVQFGIANPKSKYIYLSILNDKYPIEHMFFTFYLSIDLLFDFPFWIADRWYADDLSKHIYVDPTKDNVRSILYKIIKKKKKCGNIINIMCNQIVIDKKISLDKYLIAVDTNFFLYKIPKKYEKEIDNYDAVILNTKSSMFAKDVLSLIE